MKIAIVADDLTGAADTGVQFYPYLFDTILVPYRAFLSHHPRVVHSSMALAVYTNSRSMDPHASRQRLRQTARRLAVYSVDWIYKKIDSCLRGNPGAETEALMDAMGYDLSMIAPAFPAMGRTTIGNIHRVNGVPLDRTEMARDPVTPVSDARLSRVIARQSRHPVGHIGVPFLEESEDRLQKEVHRHVQRGVRHLVCDAVSQSHLDRIARLVLTAPHKILPVGSAGLALSLSCQLFSETVSPLPVKAPWKGGHRLLVCGTGSEITRRQLAFLLKTYDYGVVELSRVNLAAAEPSIVLKEAVILARKKLATADLVLRIDTSPSGSQYEGPRGAQRKDTAEAIVRGLGQFVAAVTTQIPPSLLFLTGGDTADAVLAAVEAEAIRLQGEIAIGIVTGNLIGGPLNGLPVITKAGAFGERDTLALLHNILQNQQRGNR